jgi:hypothetical protein
MKPMIKTGYKDYLKNQVVRAESKWARNPDDNFLFKKTLLKTWSEVKEFIGKPQEVGCMGVRDGTELFEFKAYYPKAKIYGTELSRNANNIRLVPGIFIKIQDFNNLPDDWDNKFDLLYSNSIDHSFVPEATIQEWHRVTRGFMLLEMSVTPANNIENSFESSDIKSLFPKDKFKVIKTWQDTERNVIVVFAKVIK